MSIANGSIIVVDSTSSVKYLCKDKSNHFKDVLIAPGIKKNLLSTRKLCSDNSVKVIFDDKFFVIKDRASDVELATDDIRDRLYYMDLDKIPSANMAIKGSLSTWHERFGHVVNNKLVRDMVIFSKLPISNNNKEKCESCLIGKMHKFSYKPLLEKSSSRPLELIFADVWGLTPILSKNRERYFVNFVDDYNRYNWLFPISTKLKTLIENQLDRKIKMVQTNNEGEFIVLKPLLEKFGIRHRRVCPHAHQQIGTVERHRYITLGSSLDLGSCLEFRSMWIQTQPQLGRIQVHTG